jgi:Predicted ATP-dependent serine protease
MKRAYSVTNVASAKFKVLDFAGKWREAIGCPELSGSWFIYGAPKNGKTSFAMMLAKYLSGFKRVAYDSVEEGLSLSVQMAMDRVNMMEVGSRLILLEKEGVEELIARLQKSKSPDVIVIDSVQFLELRFSEYKALKKRFPHKLFIYISHVEGKQPEGTTAKRIWRDSNVVFRIEGFKAFPVGRYGGGEPLVISQKKAEEYWGLDN